MTKRKDMQRKIAWGGGKSESTKKWKKIQTLYGLSQETLGAIFLLPFFGVCRLIRLWLVKDISVLG